MRGEIYRIGKGLYKNMRRVIIESPYAGDTITHVIYARRCIRDSLSRGESPIASHLLYTQAGILNDSIREEREWGIQAGLAWMDVADAVIFYTDYGTSKGMGGALEKAMSIKENTYFVIEERKIGKNIHGSYNTAEMQFPSVD